MRNLISLLCLFSTTWTSVSLASEATEVRMTCKVKTNAVFSIADGISKQYSSVQGGFKEGDTLHFKIALTSGIAATLEDLPYQSKNTFLFTYISENQVQALKRDETRIGFSWREGGRLLVVSSSFINVDDNLNQLTLKRYYRSDWNGIYRMTFAPELFSQVATVDCKQDLDRVDDFLRTVISRMKGSITKK
jgi:hypothetical protein